MGERGRHDTPVTFTRSEAVKIREMIATQGAALVCPRCGGELTMSLPLAGGGSVAAIWEVRCTPCCRSLMVRDLPSSGPGAPGTS